MAQRILVVDDNPDIRANLRDWLEMRGYEVSGAADAEACAHLLNQEGADLLVLDIGLPGTDGVTFLRRLREAGDETPVLMLTARDAMEDRVRGLSSGADDYLVKPFSLLELSARIEALLRRANRGRAHSIRIGPLELDLAAGTVTRDGVLLRVNPTGQRILRELMRASPGVVSREALENRIWGNDAPKSDSLRSNMHLLRNAVDKEFDAPMIRTHPGFGWSIAAPKDERSE